MTEQTTYTADGWKALNQAARACNSAYAHGDPKLIELARDVFHFVLRRVNKDCVRPYTRGETLDGGKDG